MGMLSFTCAKTNKSIRHTEEVVLVLPNNVKIRGFLGAYGEIANPEFISEKILPGISTYTVDVYSLVGKFLGCEKREEVFKMGGVTDGVNIYHFGKDFETYSYPILAVHSTKSVNQLIKEGLVFKTITMYDLVHSHIKVVASKIYQDEDFNQLEHSKECPNQGCICEENIHEFI